MTYTFKLSRRIARLRAAALATAAIAVLGCSADSFEPEDGSGPDGAPVGVSDLASASFAGGIPFGIYHQPTSTFGARYNGALRNIWPAYLLKELAAIKQRGGRVVLTFSGAEKNFKDADGHFSLSKWKQRVDQFRAVDFSAYIKDGTVIAHYLIDEPNDASNWNGRPVPPSTLEEMARYSKQIWPGLPTVVRVDPSYLSTNHQYLDAAWAQYVYRKGPAADYIRKNVTDAQNRGLMLITGMNILKGGPNGAKMTASQVQEWGSTLLNSSYPCAFISWQYDSNYLSGSGIAAAMDVLRSKAQNRSTRSCRRGESVSTPPPPPPPSEPVPVANALPFGLADAPVTEYASGWTGAVFNAEPANLAGTLSTARSGGIAVVAQLASTARTKNGDGTFSLAKWKAEVDRYRTISLGGYITDKTLYLHHLVDQPRCASCWGGTPIPWKTIEEMARYSKAIWPALPTTVRVPPSTLAKAAIKWNYLDAGWAQYSTPRGDLRTWLSGEVAQAKAIGVGVVGGLNLLTSGGPGTSPMTASQIRDFGTALVREPALCAAVGWSYDARHLGQSGIRDALMGVAAAAKARAAASCVVN